MHIHGKGRVFTISRLGAKKGWKILLRITLNNLLDTARCLRKRLFKTTCFDVRLLTTKTEESFTPNVWCQSRCIRWTLPGLRVMKRWLGYSWSLVLLIIRLLDDCRVVEFVCDIRRVFKEKFFDMALFLPFGLGTIEKTNTLPCKE